MNPCIRSGYIICIMGCTSSAPYRAISEDNATTEPNVKFAQSLYEKDMKGQNKITIKDWNETKDLKNVLPKCDTLAEPIQVISNSQNLTDLGSLDNIRDENNVVEKNNGNDSRDTSQIQKISSLEKIVERLLETNVTDNNKRDHQNLQNEKQEIDNSDKRIVTLELNDAPIETEEDIQKDENYGEAVSPTHSVSSRVTRWEALADIAAELPPSLAVDPVTGQIYALSK